MGLVVCYGLLHVHMPILIYPILIPLFLRSESLLFIILLCDLVYVSYIFWILLWWLLHHKIKNIFFLHSKKCDCLNQVYTVYILTGWFRSYMVNIRHIKSNVLASTVLLCWYSYIISYNLRQNVNNSVLSHFNKIFPLMYYFLVIKNAGLYRGKNKVLYIKDSSIILKVLLFLAFSSKIDVEYGTTRFLNKYLSQKVTLPCEFI